MSMIFGPDYEHNRRKSLEQARSCARGLAPEQIVPDAIVTHGPCKATGDRGGIQVIWRVLATNGGHVALECVRADYIRKIGYRSVAVIAEHEWYPAEHLLAELDRDANPDAQKL
jgi:hypothetical protein